MPMSLDQTEIPFSCYKEREIKSDSKVRELLYKEALDFVDEHHRFQEILYCQLD